MGSVFKTFKLMLVKEDAGIYDCDKRAVTSKEAVEILRKVCNITDSPMEKFYLLCLSSRGDVIGIHMMSQGNVNTSVIHPREIFQRAILNNATSIILAHNHPSGDPDPSADDIEVTKLLMKASEVMGIQILDHLVVGDESYVSMADRGLLNDK
jgi:DNA repair protein RadC